MRKTLRSELDALFLVGVLIAAFLFFSDPASAATMRGANSMPCPASAPCDGFYTRGNQVIDPSGQPIVFRATNQAHYDSWGGAPAAKAMGANMVRISLNFTKTEAVNWAVIQPFVAAGIVPMPGNWTGTCKSDLASLTAIVDAWVAQAPTWTKLNKTGLVNIANEWGPAGSTAWRDAYVAAIPRMRAAGYTGTLVVDAGGCGQDAVDVVKYGAAVLAADPLGNLLFDVHVYGAFHDPATATWQQDLRKSIVALKATGLPIILGEIGPGRNIGPSPTMVTPATIIGLAEDNGFSWAVWASDDGNLANCAANDASFALSKKCGTYTGAAAELTLFGGQVVPVLQTLARPAGI